MANQSKQYEISAEESERIQILKIWFTIMVIFIHSYTEEVHFSEGTLILQVPVWIDWIKTIISRIISRCAVPGYFFISAVLLFRKGFTWIENVKKKLKTLLVPYLILNTAWIVIFFVAQHIAAFSSYFSNDSNIISEWGGVQFANAYLGFDGGYPILYPLWFMRDLMVLNLFAVVIKMLIDRFPKTVFTILTLMVLLNIQTHLFFLRQDALIFFCLGYYFVKYSVSFDDLRRIKKQYIVLSYLTVGVIAFASRNADLNYLPSFASIIIGFIFFYQLASQIPQGSFRKVLMYIAKYSFSIYLFHEMSLTILKKLLTRIFPQTELWQIILYFGIPVIIFGFCLTFGIFLDKHCHKFYLVLVGSRNK